MKVFRERTNLRTILGGLIVAAIGALLLVLSIAWPPITTHPALQAVLREFGALFVASVAVAVLWELSSRRALLAEMLAETKLVEEVETTGLSGVSAEWHGKIDWGGLFDSSDRFELLFAYGRTWRNTYRDALEKFASRKNVRATIVLPDPDDPRVVEELARRFSQTPEQLAQNVREAQQDFITVFNRAGDARRKLSIWFIPLAPVWSYYRFNGGAVFTLYKHKPGREEVPTFTVKKGGTLYTFFKKEYDALVAGKHPIGRKVFPETRGSRSR
jgi:hypothetical protein